MTFEQAHAGPWPTSITVGSLSDTLARDGYVVLVLYRRGHKGSEGTTSTYSERIAIGGTRIRSATEVMHGAEAETADVIAALEYLRTQPFADADRIAVGGVSLGGLVSVMAASRDPRFAALISMAGGIRWSVLGGFDEARPLVQGAWKEAGRRLRTPVLILWSENDVSLNESVGRDLESELRRAGVNVEMKVYPAFRQNGHTLFTLAEGYPVYVPDAKRFLDSCLKR
jgi:dienelactone hydrolase